jgi:LPS export ABC transporter permease LptG
MASQLRLRPRILEKYVAREYLKIVLLSLAAFWVIYLVVDFFEKIDRLLQSDLGLGDICQYLLLRAPAALEQVIFPAILLGALLTFGIFHRTRETWAIQTSGLDILRLSPPVLLLAGVAAVLLLLLHLYLIPWSQGHLGFFWDTRVQKKPPRSLINPEHFWYKGDRAIYNILLFRKELQILEGVKIFRFDPGFRLIQVVAARQAAWENGRWRLTQGIVQTFDPSGEEKSESFIEMFLDLTEKPEDFSSLEKKITEMDLGELLRFSARLERDGYKPTQYRLEIQSRIALSLAPLVLAALGLGLALRQRETSLPILVAKGLALLFLYWLVLGFANSLGQAGRWPILGAVWLPHLMFGILALTLFRGVVR